MSGLLVVAPMTNPAAIPPIDAFQGSFLPLADSARHSTEAKAVAAAPNQNAGREMVLKIAPESEVIALAANRLAAPPTGSEVTGSGYHAS